MTAVLTYLPAILAFVASLVAVVGRPKWDDTQQGFRRVTKLGWFVIALALAALSSASVITWKSQRDLAQSQTQRETLRRLAHTEIRVALQDLMREFLPILWTGKDGMKRERMAACASFPSCMLDKPVEDAVGVAMSPDWRRPGQLEDLLTKNPEDFRDKPDMLRRFEEQLAHHNWAAFAVTTQERIFDHSSEMEKRVDRTLEIYSAYLEPEVLILVSKLQRSDYFWVLQHLDPNKNLYWDSNQYGRADFWQNIIGLDKALFRDMSDSEVSGFTDMVKRDLDDPMR